jgi:hypothetical protein
LPHFTFHAIMQVLLNQVDAQFEVRGRTIWILPADKPQPLAERLHPARRLHRGFFDRSVDLNGVEGEVPLSEALKKVCDEFDLTHVIDTRSFERGKASDIEKRPVRLARRTNVRLGVVLEELLQQAGATFVVRDRGLVVVIPAQQ